MQKLYTFSCRFIQIFSLVLTALFFLGSFLSTCYSTDMTSQVVLTRWDSLFSNLAGIGLFFVLLWAASVFFRKDRIRLLTGIVLAWCFLVGAVLVLFGKTVPAADAMSVYSIAEALAAGDTSVIHPTASYLSYYPQQVGLVAFFELLIRLIRIFPISVPAYHLIKCFYVLLAAITILFQKKIVHLLWKSKTVDCFYLLLMGANLPFLMYTSFVYGEIPSFAAITLGFFFLAKLWKEHAASHSHTFLRAAAALLFLTIGVMLRKNNLILIIAVLIVVFLHGLKNKRYLLLVWGLLCGMCCFLVLPATQKYYELRSGSTLSSGVTATSYFAMGMQESSRANGWYNGFNFNTYRDTGMDTSAANEISREAIQKRLTYFKENPAYAARFYLQKHLSQWADGTYASRQATLATFGGRSSFFDSLYEGNASLIFIEYCNLYQNILYLGTLLFSVSAFRKKEDNLPIYLGLIGIVGGVLFHIIWEANSRYILLYGLLLVPYAARGLTLAAKRFFTESAAHAIISLFKT